MSKIFTPQVFVKILNLVDQGFSAAEIAEKVGCTLNSLRVKCSQQGICLRRRAKFGPGITRPERLTVRISGNVAVRLEQQAGKQGISGTKFAANLLEAIVRDNLYDAVIDQDVVGRLVTDDISN
jgi:predicted HicB family RNase H-like nuclease